MIRTLLAALVVWMLAACSLAAPRVTAPLFPPLPPSTLGAARSALQLVQGSFGTHELAFQSVISADAGHLTLVVLGAEGQRWFSLRHDGRSLEVQSSALAPPALEPQRVLADLQLALWPLAALQQALDGSVWQVSEPVAATRRLRRDGRLISEVHYAGSDPWRGQFWLSNFAQGYSLAVESRPLP